MLQIGSEQAMPHIPLIKDKHQTIEAKKDLTRIRLVIQQHFPHGKESEVEKMELRISPESGIEPPNGRDSFTLMIVTVDLPCLQ